MAHTMADIYEAFLEEKPVDWKEHYYNLNKVVESQDAEISKLRSAIADHRDSPGEADNIDRKLWDVLPSGF